MTKSIETTGHNRDAAIEAALTQLGLDRDAVSVEVLDNGKKGIFGIGATPARVRVSYEAPDEAPVKKPEAPRPAAKPAPSRPAAPAAKPAPAAAKPAAPAAKPAPRPAAPAAQEDEMEELHTPHIPKTPLAADQIPQIGHDAVTFIDGLMEKLGIEGHAVVLDTTREDHLQLEIVGPDMGPVIGRRGDTLDAIQYLTSLVSNRSMEDHVRITIDTENYRERRAESLTRLARKMAGKVLRYHKNMTLEPMNPYERRIIHSALQEYRGVTTYSTGTEPGRRVVIALEGSRAPSSGGNRGGSAQRSRGGSNDQ